MYVEWVLTYAAMFEPKENPGYRQLAEDAKHLIVKWSRNEWYQASNHQAIK